MRVGRGVGDFSRLRRIEVDRERVRLALSLDFERPEDALRFASRSVLMRARSRDFGRSLPSFSLESSFLDALRLFDLDWRRLRRSPPLLEDEEDDELQIE